jgi:hypothetical protein
MASIKLFLLVACVMVTGKIVLEKLRKLTGLTLVPGLQQACYPPSGCNLAGAVLGSSKGLQVVTSHCTLSIVSRGGV